jgi:predicted enzyme related to lactoylglutathione lyase
MITNILSFTLIVANQDEALTYYTEALGFEKRSDNPMGEGMRWVTVAPRDSNVELVLQPPDWFEGEERAQKLERVGQSPTIVFRVVNCRETYATLRDRGVKSVDEPTDTGWGVQAVFNDLYGNGFVLLERPF